MRRIVFTLAVGKRKHAETALGLARSLRLIGDTTPRVLATDIEDPRFERCFDKVIPCPDPIEWIMFSKLRALDWTDADQVLYIDADSLAFRRLAPIFEYCQGRGFCVQGEIAEAGYWFGDLEAHRRRHGVPALPTFNGGMIYYERSPETLEFLEIARELGRQQDQHQLDFGGSWVNDEFALALAMAKSGYGHVIPDEMDFTNTAGGLIGRLELDVLRGRCRFVSRRRQVRLVEPYLFHAGRYINFLIYWRQLAALERLDRYEEKHPMGYMSPLHRLRRSIERRILKLLGKI